jgi:hypothetical protein
MAAKPRPPAVERAEEQRRARQRAEGTTGRRVVAEHARAEVGVEAVEHGGLKDEAALVLRRGAQDLVGEGPEEVLAAGGELLGHLADLVAEAQAQRRQVERRGPALGAPLERGDVRRVELEAEPVAQEAQRLVVGEAQVVGAQVEHLALDAQAPERVEAEVAAAGDEHAVGARQAGEHPVEAVARGGVAEREVEVVEDQRDGLRRRRERVEQRDEDAGAQVRLGRLGGVQRGIQAWTQQLVQPRQHRRP